MVVAYDMARELPRTLRTLAPGFQRGIDPGDLEVVVVDNGSPEPVDPTWLEPIAAAGAAVRLERLDPAPPSPAAAANHGLALARGALVGLIVDGARMASPGLVATARRAARLDPRPVVAALAWHLGDQRHEGAGHDQGAEDALLDGLGWEGDGYRLFEVSTLANSSGRGWFGPMGESSALFLPRALWDELGGLDEAFALPGGGLVNHDLYRRACELSDTELIVLLGEGTFHQFHGGAATSGAQRWEDMRADYEAIRGLPHRPPERAPWLVGRMPPAALEQVGASVELAIRRRDRGRR